MLPLSGTYFICAKISYRKKIIEEYLNGLNWICSENISVCMYKVNVNQILDVIYRLVTQANLIVL